MMASPTVRVGLSDASGFWNTIWISLSTDRRRLPVARSKLLAVQTDVARRWRASAR